MLAPNASPKPLAALQPADARERGDVYLNFIGDEEGRDRVIAGWGKDNYSRLQRVKREYDPHNVFRLNHNISP